MQGPFLHRIIPDLVINGRSLSGEGPLPGIYYISDVKTLSSCSTYPDDRTGNPNAAVYTRQKKVNVDYHTKAESLDVREGDMCGGFEAELSSYGQARRVIGPVVGSFGEMSSDAHAIAKEVAGLLALELCSIYGDRALKAAKGFSLNQLCRSWGLNPANIISHALQKQGARMLNEHQIDNQRSGGSITVKRIKPQFFFSNPFF